MSNFTKWPSLVEKTITEYVRNSIGYYSRIQKTHISNSQIIQAITDSDVDTSTTPETLLNKKLVIAISTPPNSGTIYNTVYKTFILNYGISYSNIYVSKDHNYLLIEMNDNANYRDEKKVGLLFNISDINSFIHIEGPEDIKSPFTDFANDIKGFIYDECLYGNIDTDGTFGPVFEYNQGSSVGKNFQYTQNNNIYTKTELESETVTPEHLTIYKSKIYNYDPSLVDYDLYGNYYNQKYEITQQSDGVYINYNTSPIIPPIIGVDIDHKEIRYLLNSITGHQEDTSKLYINDQEMAYEIEISGIDTYTIFNNSINIENENANIKTTFEDKPFYISKKWYKVTNKSNRFDPWDSKNTYNNSIITSASNPNDFPDHMRVFHNNDILPNNYTINDIPVDISVDIVSIDIINKQIELSEIPAGIDINKKIKGDWLDPDGATILSIDNNTITVDNILPNNYTINDIPVDIVSIDIINKQIELSEITAEIIINRKIKGDWLDPYGATILSIDNNTITVVDILPNNYTINDIPVDIPVDIVSMDIINKQIELSEIPAGSVINKKIEGEWLDPDGATILSIDNNTITVDNIEDVTFLIECNYNQPLSYGYKLTNDTFVDDENKGIFLKMDDGEQYKSIMFGKYYFTETQKTNYQFMLSYSDGSGLLIDNPQYEILTKYGVYQSIGTQKIYNIDIVKNATHYNILRKETFSKFKKIINEGTSSSTINSVEEKNGIIITDGMITPISGNGNILQINETADTKYAYKYDTEESKELVPQLEALTTNNSISKFNIADDSFIVNIFDNNSFSSMINKIEESDGSLVISEQLKSDQYTTIVAISKNGNNFIQLLNVGQDIYIPVVKNSEAAEGTYGFDTIDVSNYGGSTVAPVSWRNALEGAPFKPQFDNLDSNLSYIGPSNMNEIELTTAEPDSISKIEPSAISDNGNIIIITNDTGINIFQNNSNSDPITISQEVLYKSSADCFVIITIDLPNASYKIYKFDGSKNTLVRTIDANNTEIDIYDDGSKVVIAKKGSNIEIYDINNGTLESINIQYKGEAFGISGNGRYIYTNENAEYNSPIIKYDTENNNSQKIDSPNSDSNYNITNIESNHDGSYFALYYHSASGIDSIYFYKNEVENSGSGNSTGSEPQNTVTKAKFIGKFDGGSF